LFDKSRNLYNFKPAREAVGKGQPLVVAEGYMDVIALSEAGFGGAVAPLGTAVTETQLQLLWRLSDEPLIALDGDKAGLRAAYRVIDLALPLLGEGRGLRFALMPDGKDPDDVLRSDGPGAVDKVLQSALPMVQLLWRRETEGRVFDSPERRAALELRLNEATAQIRDPMLKGHYAKALKDLQWTAFRAPRAPRGKGWSPKPLQAAPVESTRRSTLVAADETVQRELRQAVILVALMEDMDCVTDVLDRLRRVLLTAAPGELAREAETVLGQETLETLVSARHLSVVPCLRKPGDEDMARLTIAEELAKLAAEAGWQAELTEAEQDLDVLADEALTWRLAQAARARANAGRSEDGEDVDYDVGPNGAHIDREEREALESLLSRIRFDKTKPS
jgi:DNA primase